MELVWALNTVSGQVGRIPRHILEHAHFGQYQVAVAPGTKSYDPELWHPQTAEEYLASHSTPVYVPEANDADGDENEETY